jgi:hypothetical protein
MQRRQPKTVVRQEVHWVPESRVLSLPVKPFRVWTLYQPVDLDRSEDSTQDPTVTPTLPITPVHNYNAFLEDYVHDWQWYEGGKFRYYSRVARDRIWILVEYSEVVKPKNPRPRKALPGTNLVNINGINIRFFLSRKDAINNANTLTRLFNLQHTPKYAPDKGWCIRAAGGQYYDADGKVPTSLDNECKRVRKVKS